MLKAVEATIERDGRIHLLEPLGLTHSCRAIVSFAIREVDESTDREMQGLKLKLEEMYLCSH